MKGPAVNRNEVRLWNSRTIDGLELKRATLKNFSFGRHMDDSYVVCLVQGGAELFGCRGMSYVACPGDIVLYNPEDVHDGCSLDRRPWSYRCFYAAEPLVRRIESEALGGWSAPWFPEKVVHDPELAVGWSALHRRMEAGEDALRDPADFGKLFADLVERHASCSRAATDPAGHDIASLLRSRDFLEAHAGARVTLDRLSSLAGLSPFHFLREFKRRFGMPPHQYRRQVQVRRARGLLAQGVPIAAAAAEAGFFDQSHLSRVLKSFTGLTPGQLRS